jgi:hypothetical protein
LEDSGDSSGLLLHDSKQIKTSGGALPISDPASKSEVSFEELKKLLLISLFQVTSGSANTANTEPSSLNLTQELAKCLAD